MTDIDRKYNNANILLDLGEITVLSPGGTLRFEPDNPYYANFTSRITTEMEGNDAEDSPISFIIETTRGVFSLQFTKRQAIILGDFLKLAWHVKEE